MRVYAWLCACVRAEGASVRQRACVCVVVCVRACVQRVHQYANVRVYAWLCACVRACVCVCVCDRQTDRDRETERGL